MAVSDEIIEEARVNPVGAALKSIDAALEEVNHSGQWDMDSLAILLESYAFIAELVNARIIPSVTTRSPSVGSNISDSCQGLLTYLNAARSSLATQAIQMKLDEHRSRFRLRLGGVFAYEFTQGDLDRVQHLLNELRALISAVDGLDEEHRQRILASLEKTQKELHKKVSDFDRFYGFAAQVSSLLHKVGTDAKPIVDRVRELLGIAWETQARGDELPSGTEPPLLPKPSDQEQQAGA